MYDKFAKCLKCRGANGGIQRRIFYLTDRVEVHCKSCGDVVTFMKKPNAREKAERKIKRIFKSARAA